MSGSRWSSSSRQQSGSSSRISDDQIIDLILMLREVLPEIHERCSDRGCHCEAWSMPPTSPDERPTPDALKKFLEESEAWNSNLDFSGLEKIETIGGTLAFYSAFWVEDIINMPMHGLHAPLQEKSLLDILRDKKKGELAARSFAKFKGKAAATSGYDTGESSNNTSFLNSPFRTESRQRCELDHLSIPLARHKLEIMTDRSNYAGASASGISLNGHTEGTVVITGRGSPASTSHRYLLPHPHLSASASRNEQAHLQESNAKCRNDPTIGTIHYQQSPAYAHPDADVEAGAFPALSEPPLETIAISKEPPAMILISGAFALLSGNPETLRGPMERVLLGVMTVGFICSFMWLLMGGRRRRRRLSSLIQWTAVWAMFVSFFLVITLLMTH